MRLLGLTLSLLLLAGCTSMPATPAVARAGAAPSNLGRITKPRIYWTFFSNQANPQLETATTPLSQTTNATDIDGDAQDMLKDVCCVRVHQNMIWVLIAPSGSSNANELLIFRSPLKTGDLPLYYDTLSSSNFAVHMEFDSHGNLWVSSLGTKRASPAVDEYSGDFLMVNGTISPSLTLNVGFTAPQGIAFDKNGYLYVADGNANDIAVFAQPIQNQQPYYLNGVTTPAGVVFDKNGNLFASSNASTGAVVEYPSTDLHSGNKPKIVDRTGINPSPYGSDLQFDRAGNLYDGDCGSTAGIYTYEISTQKFTSKLAPAFYTNSTISTNGCVWSLANI